MRVRARVRHGAKQYCTQNCDDSLQHLHGSPHAWAALRPAAAAAAAGGAGTLTGTAPAALLPPPVRGSAWRRRGRGLSVPRDWRLTSITYALDAGQKMPGRAQIVRNYQNAFASLGGQTVFQIDEAAMTQDVVANAAMFSNDIDATGHAAVYGIFFATGKADL
jgi:hypothetical protein